MKRTLAFADGHLNMAHKYDELAAVSEREEVSSVVYLGDTDGLPAYVRLLALKEKIAALGIDINMVKGNHDQAWLDFIAGKDIYYALHPPHTDMRMRNRADIRDLLEGMEIQFENDGLYFRHTFFEGKTASGHCDKIAKLYDPRERHPELWYYSFGTDETERHPDCDNRFSRYDRTVLNMNFDRMDTLGARALFKGHEHLPKIWTRTDEGQICGGTVISAGSTVNLEDTSIVQIGDFQRGHYAIIEDAGEELRVEFRNLKLAC